MIRMVPAFIFMLLAGVLLLVLTEMEKPEPTPQQGALVDSAMPTLPVVDGKSADAPLTLKSYAGHVTFVNVFASWCNPCAEEMSELVKLKHEVPQVQFVGIAWNDGPATIDAWLKKHGNPFDGRRYDNTGRAAMALGLRGIPESFVVDDKGVVQAQIPGNVTADMREKMLVPLLKQLVAEAHAS